MHFKSKDFVLYFFLLLFGKMLAQQDSQYTQYMYNSQNINPAYIGSTDFASIFGLYRAQWVGMEGAPVTYTASFQTPLNNKTGVGISFLNDEIGASNEKIIAVDYAYTLNLNYVYRFSFGLKASANFLNVDFNKLTIYDPTDALLEQNQSLFSPNVGAGVFLFSERSYLGLSVPQLLETKYLDGSSISIAKKGMHFYFTGGYVFKLNDLIKFKPAFLTKVVEGSPLQVDVSTNFMWNNVFSLGASYRWSSAVSLLAGFQVNNQVFIGYAYDSETTNLANYNSGSHEIFLRFDFKKTYDIIMSPRFF